MYFAKILALVVVLAVAAHCAPTKQKNTKISCESNITRTNTFILVNRINKFSMFRHSEISAFSKDHFWIFELWAGLLSSNAEFIMTLKSKKSRTPYLKKSKKSRKIKKIWNSDFSSDSLLASNNACAFSSWLQSKCYWRYNGPDNKRTPFQIAQWG